MGTDFETGLRGRHDRSFDMALDCDPRHGLAPGSVVVDDCDVLQRDPGSCELIVQALRFYACGTRSTSA